MFLRTAQTSAVKPSSETRVHQLLVFERKVLRTICSPKIENCVYRRRYNHELDKEFDSSNALNVTKTSRFALRWSHDQKFRRERVACSIESILESTETPLGWFNRLFFSPFLHPQVWKVCKFIQIFLMKFHSLPVWIHTGIAYRNPYGRYSQGSARNAGSCTIPY
jgi:hypothetical protein